MKVLMINGSPKANGNTAAALAEMEKIFTQEGIEAETIQVGHQAIRGCVACGGCYRAGKCVIDDSISELADKFQAADGLVIASPVYYASANATLTAAMFIHNQAFKGSYMYNRASAASMLIFIMVAVCSAVVFFLMRDKNEARR